MSEIEVKVRVDRSKLSLDEAVKKLEFYEFKQRQRVDELDLLSGEMDEDKMTEANKLEGLDVVVEGRAWALKK